MIVLEKASLHNTWFSEKLDYISSLEANLSVQDGEAFDMLKSIKENCENMQVKSMIETASINAQDLKSYMQSRSSSILESKSDRVWWFFEEGKL